MSMQYLFVFFISLLPIFSIFLTTDLNHTHDGFVHLARMGAYFKALADAQIPVRWAGDLNYGYGMPLFNFIYQLPYFLSSVFLSFGFGLVITFKIVLVLSYILSGIFMFAFGKAFFNDDKKALLITVFYQFSPFRLVEILVRGSFGEVYAYTFLPFVLFGLTLLLRKQTYRNFSIVSLATALLILSHNALSLVFFGICVLFTLFFASEKKKIIYGFCALGVGLLLTSFYWIPAIFEHKYTYGDLFMREMYLSHFPPFANFFIPNFTNSEVLQTGGISVQIGLFHIIGLFLSIMVLYRRKLLIVDKKIIIFSLILTLSAFILMEPLSKILWGNISLLRQFQFPWRFLAVVSFATSLLSVSFLFFDVVRKKWAYYTLLFLVIISTAYYWNPPLGFDKIDEKYYWNFPLNTTYFGETDVIWSTGPAKAYPKQRVEIIGGQANLSNFTKRSNVHTFTVDAKTSVQLVDHTQYFPGWRVFVDDKPVSIEFQDQHWRGEITFVIPKGTHNVKAVFGESPIRFFADILSLSSLAALFFVWILHGRKKI